MGISSRTGRFIYTTSTNAIMLHVWARSPNRATRSILVEFHTWRSSSERCRKRATPNSIDTLPDRRLQDVWLTETSGGFPPSDAAFWGEVTLLALRPAVALGAPVRPQGLQDAARRHRELIHPDAYGVVNGVGDGGHGRHDGHLTHPSHAKRVGGIGHLDDHRIDHREVQTRGHAIVQEARIDHAAGLVVVILFIQSPADALHRPALHLILHIAGMNRLAGILDGGVAQDGDLACLRIHLHIHEVRGDAWTGAARIDPSTAGDGATSGILAGRELLEGQTFLGGLRV